MFFTSLFSYLSMQHSFNSEQRKINVGWPNFNQNKFVLIIFGALFFSSLTIAILEACLPFWLIQNFNIEVRILFLICNRLQIIIILQIGKLMKKCDNSIFNKTI